MMRDNAYNITGMEFENVIFILRISFLCSPTNDISCNHTDETENINIIRRCVLG